MLPIVETANFYLALGTVLLQVAILAAVVDWAVFNGMYVVRHLAPYALRLAFLMSLLSIALTLVYSEVFGFIPCGLCWLQRVFLYPQALILGIALFRKDTQSASAYGIPLSILGGIIAFYQHYLQMGGSEFVKCPTSSGDCAQRIVFEFGYVTFPLMSLTLFIALVVLYMIARRYVSAVVSTQNHSHV